MKYNNYLYRLSRTLLTPTLQYGTPLKHTHISTVNQCFLGQPSQTPETQMAQRTSRWRSHLTCILFILVITHVQEFLM